MTFVRRAPTQVHNSSSSAGHSSRVAVHHAELHRWLCALEEALVSNAVIIFHRLIQAPPPSY